MFVLTHWPEIDKLKPDRLWLFDGFDKVVHFSLYACWTALWWWLLSLNQRGVGFASANWLIVGGVAYAVFDELTQSFFARDPELADFACDVAAILIVTTVLRVWQRGRLAKPA